MKRSESMSELVANLEKKAEKVLHLHQSFQAENQRLRETVQQLKDKVKQLEQEKQEAEERYTTLKIARTVSGNEEKNLALKLRINELVREIDNCMAQLNR